MTGHAIIVDFAYSEAPAGRCATECAVDGYVASPLRAPPDHLRPLMPQMQAPPPAVGVRPPTRSLRPSILLGGAEGGSPCAADPDVEPSASSAPTAKVTAGLPPHPCPPSFRPPCPCLCHCLLLHPSLPPESCVLFNAAFSHVKFSLGGAGACSFERLSQVSEDA